MPNYRVQVSLTSTTNIARDKSVNVWHFVADDTTAITAAVDELWADVYDDFFGYFSPLVSQNNHNIKVYNLADPEPRAPVLDVTKNFTVAPAGTAIPNELALCLSFQGNKVSGESQARRRGRVYFGPLDLTTVEDGRVSDGARAALAALGDSLLDASNAAATWSWCVYSVTDQEMVAVTNGWVDNAFDVQRRRGLDATVRTTFAT